MFSNVLCFVLLSDGRIRSVISFNRGGKWRQLKKPENVDCSEQTKRVGWRTFIHIALFPGHFFSIRKGKGKGKKKEKEYIRTSVLHLCVFVLSATSMFMENTVGTTG